MKIFILCPSGSKTGGAECLHQFGNALISNGIDAHMSYYPDKTGSGAPDFFSQYQVPVSETEDNEKKLIIIPELSTHLIKQFPLAKKAVYWLSIDNYFYRKRQSIIADLYRRFRSLTTTRVPIKKMKHLVHISQSFYATEYLKKQGLTSIFVGDYLNDAFFQLSEKIRSEKRVKKNQVAYNPKKGFKYIKYLSKKYPEIPFVPIINMTREEVINLLADSKVYIDLGQHPGKDRIPREAASLGCCIITSKKGSAYNDVDIPIASEYKFDLNKKQLDKITEKIKHIFNNFNFENKKFISYCEMIRKEKDTFISDTKKLIQFIEEK